MKQVKLGRSQLTVSRVCLGTMNFGGRTPEPDSIRILDRAFEAGISFVDTANVYGHDPAEFTSGRGRSEEIIGRWLPGRRDDVVVATKMYFPMHDGPGALGPSRANVTAECEASLRRLGTDRIDLYQLHHPSNEVPIDETLAALDELVTAGKVRYIGTSSFAAWQLVEGLWSSSALGLAPFVSEQPVYNLLDRRVERELVGAALTHEIGLLTWSPLAGGVLAGRYNRGESAEKGSRHDVFWSSRHSVLDTAVFDVLDRLSVIALEAGKSLLELSYGWLLAQQAVTSMIVGPRTVEHLDTALACADLTLGADVLSAIDTVVAPGQMVYPQYGHDGFTWVPWGPGVPFSLGRE